MLSVGLASIEQENIARWPYNSPRVGPGTAQRLGVLLKARSYYFAMRDPKQAADPL